MQIYDVKQQYQFPIYNKSINNPYFSLKIRLFDNYFKETNINFFKEIIGSNIKNVIDIGAWVGKSTNWFANNINVNGNIFAIDSWDLQVFDKEEISPLDIFIGQCWIKRFNIYPIKLDIFRALFIFSKCGREIDLVYIDVFNNRRDMIKLLNWCIKIFPNAIICGANYNHRGVRRAVQNCKNDNEVVNNDYCWRYRKPIIEPEICKCKCLYNPIVKNTELCFMITVYKETKMLELCLKYLRINYYDENVVVISEGDNDSKLLELARKFRFKLLLGGKIKLIKYGMNWWHRWVYNVSNINAQYYIKLDPDTKITRKFKDFPDADLFGKYNFIDRYGYVSRDLIQGCCKGLSRRAINLLLESQICLSDRYLDISFRREGCRFKKYLDHISEDKCLFDMINRLGLTWKNWEEVCIEHEYINTNEYAAVTGLWNEL